MDFSFVQQKQRTQSKAHQNEYQNHHQQQQQHFECIINKRWAKCYLKNVGKQLSATLYGKRFNLCKIYQLFAQPREVFHCFFLFFSLILILSISIFFFARAPLSLYRSLSAERDCGWTWVKFIFELCKEFVVVVVSSYCDPRMFFTGCFGLLLVIK